MSHTRSHRKGPNEQPAWRTAKPGTLPRPAARKHYKNFGSKRWFWPASQIQLDAWRAKRAADYAANNPEQLDLFRHALAAIDAAEAQPAKPVWPKPPRRRPQR